MARVIKVSMKKRSNIIFETVDNISRGDVVYTKMSTFRHYFIVEEVSVTGLGRLSVSASEYGYYNTPSKIDGFDIRSLMSADVIVESDSKMLSDLKEESCYC